METSYLLIVLLAVLGLILFSAPFLYIKTKLNNAKTAPALDRIFHYGILRFFRHFLGVHIFFDFTYEKLKKIIKLKEKNLERTSNVYEWVDAFEEISNTSFIKNNNNLRDELLQTFTQKTQQLISNEIVIFQKAKARQPELCKEVRKFSSAVDGFLYTTKDSPMTKQLVVFVKDELDRHCGP